MALPLTRKIDLLASLLGCFVLGFAYYLEIYQGLTACPLCIIQRLLFLALIIMFLGGGIIPLMYFARRFYHFFTLLIACLGIVVAARHVWLIHHAHVTNTSCSADVQTLFKYLPANQVLQMIFQGSGDCTHVSWTLFTLSIPAWALIFFIIFALIALWQVVHKDKMWVE